MQIRPDSGSLTQVEATQHAPSASPLRSELWAARSNKTIRSIAFLTFITHVPQLFASR